MASGAGNGGDWWSRLVAMLVIVMATVMAANMMIMEIAGRWRSCHTKMINSRKKMCARKNTGAFFSDKTFGFLLPSPCYVCAFMREAREERGRGKGEGEKREGSGCLCVARCVRI